MPGFSSPPDPEDFKLRVWEVVKQIPSGKVATYGQIASYLEPPGGMDPQKYKAFGARWVGGAMAACPENVPWHRVINAKGMVSLRDEAGGELQRMRLEEEGIYFDPKQRVDLKLYAWDGPGSKEKTEKARQLSLMQNKSDD